MVTKIIGVAESERVVAFTERVKTRKDELLRAKPKLMPERSRLFTESWKETEADPLSVRYAKAFARVLEGIPVVIRDGELIVGSMTTEVRGCYAAPEYNVDQYLSQLGEGELAYAGGAVKYNVSEEARRSILDDARYWNGKSVYDKTLTSIRQKWGNIIPVDDGEKDSIWSVPWTVPLICRGVDYPKVLGKGLNGVIAEIKEELAKLENFTEEGVQKFHFLWASLISCEAVINYAKRHAQLASQLAQDEKESKRKKELEEIARIFERVPAEPATSFREAVQSFWTCFLAAELEGISSGPTIGRWDQYMYPFYAKDVREGKLTGGEAAELIALLLVKCSEMEVLKDKKRQEAIQGTYLINFPVGGQTADGRDAVNELSFLMLEAARQTRVPAPHISLRYHDGIDEEFLIKAVECNRDHGAGVPAFFNDKVAILRMADKGIPVSKAREWIPVGCVESFIYLENTAQSTCMFFSLPKILEFALNNGVDPRTGTQWGPRTGDPRGFTSYEQFYQAFKEQLTFMMDTIAEINKHSSVIIGENYRAPFYSTFMKGCMERGLDVTQGGQRSHVINVTLLPFGHQNIANSLAAIKKVVFEKKSISVGQLLDALASNFEGKEDVQHLLLSAPKWGNDDDYVDDIMRDLFDLTLSLGRKHVSPWGDNNPINISRQGHTRHYLFGKVVGALPDGRKAWELLADGSLSPMRGTDVKGPTAVLKSASKVDQIGCEATLLNMKISPSVVRDVHGIKKLISLIKTYFDLNGYHIQFNMVGRETLLEAKKHPEQYRDLLVRVAGYSAFFVQLAPEVQDEIIARTEYSAL